MCVHVHTYSMYPHACEREREREKERKKERKKEDFEKLSVMDKLISWKK